jgi:hypothetical protein
MSSQVELRVDPRRWDADNGCAAEYEGSEVVNLPSTGIFVRAKDPEGEWCTVDIWALDRASLLAWLRSRGGDNPWAENVVGILLGHGNLHGPEEG